MNVSHLFKSENYKLRQIFKVFIDHCPEFILTRSLKKSNSHFYPTSLPSIEFKSQFSSINTLDRTFFFTDRKSC